ncbi:fibronectin type III domain-containing protein [Vallitalea pronyensis]|uniref:Fibronectin type III domain-containing protein n=1 Tax=Vallitalea pronyensis TaxID=1348613 RepID=A0A8J8MNQ3_9FIRM|nr:S-layer homology domain-containing protein [Vallitalea pronyensis]QUI24801.1 fibronectin type III domain-containing protein [Vallitalea pronyensis]
MSKKSFVSLILIIILMFTSIESANAQALEYLDTEGHWAEKEILKWSAEGLLQGYQGYFRPNDNITIAEVATIIDNLMKYQEVGQNTFADLKDTWYTEAVLKNVKAGTMTDVEGQLRVEELATRQEVVVMFAKAFGIDPTEGPTYFNDDKQIADTARGYILSFYNKGYIVGMPSGDFEPESNIRRASIVKIFDNILAEWVTEKGQVTGTYEGTVIINSPDVVLKDSTISGDLIIAPGVGEGEATINNTQVKGSFIVNGGGKNSITILGNSSFEGIIIKKQGDAVRVVAEEGIVVPEIVIAGQSNVIIDGKAEYKNVKVVGAESVEIRQGTAIKEIVVEAKAVAIDNLGKIENVQITEKAEGSVISGKGSIEEVLVKADNIKVEAEITKVIVEEGIKGTLVDGKEIEGGTQVDKKNTPVVVNPPSSGGSTPSTPTTPTDQVAPVITLTTNKLMSATVNVIAEQPDWTKYFSVTDNRDGAITVTASMISGTVDITKVGDYTITLNARDDAGNTASKTITFKMKDTYMAGDGLSAATAYEIESIEDLALIGSGYTDGSKQYALNSYYELVRDLDFESDDSYENPNIKDTRDRDGDGDVDETLKSALTALNSGKGFIPITMSNAGNIASPFTGTIDGNGHTISKLYINIPTHDEIGFIGRGDGATVKNLKMTNAKVTGQNRVGILVGNVNNGTITDSSAEGTLNIKAGLGGLLAGESQSSTIKNSSTKGSVNGIGTGPEFLNNMLGGLIGSSSDTEITNCHSLTNVKGLNDIGGLIGKDSNSKVDQSSSNGTINGKDRIGGLIGLSSGTTVENSNAKGTVTGTSDVGGLIGKIDGGIYQYNSSSATITGDASVGGLIGNIQTDSGNVGVLNSYATGNVTGKTKVGGLVGSYYQFPIRVITIAYCYSSGDVHGDPNYASSSGIGGLIGQTSSGTISNSIAYNNTITSKPGVANRFIGVTEGFETLQSNYAKSDMTINSVVGTSGTGSDVNGADVSVSQFSTAGFFTSTNNWSDKVWDFNYIWQINNGEMVPTHTKVSTRVDTTPPEISFGFSNVNPFYTLGQISTEPDWTGLFKVKDDLDGDITVTQAMITENVDITKAGVYPITINVSDAAGNSATATYDMRIMANVIPPVITVDTSKKTVFYKGVDTVKPDWKSYFTANDDADGPITIIDSMITDSVDLSTVGTYSIIVTCNDSSGNTGQKTISIEVKEDSVGPTVGNSGTISVSNIGTTGLTLNWIKATDNASIASNLIYEAYLSTSNNLDTVSNTETNGTLIGSASTDIATVNVTGLNPDTTYYFNIIVKDQIGNKSLYSTKTQKTSLIPDTEAPAVGNSGTMTITNVDVTGLTLNWTKATDNISASTALTYQAYYSTSNNLDTISNTETNGTPIGTASADIGTINVTGLSEDTTYYFNVIVTDEAGNESMYTAMSQKTNLTPDVEAPTVGNSGTITASNVAVTGLTLNWTKATDNRSAGTALTYQAYYSTSNNLDTVSNTETNGTPIGTSRADIATIDVTGLTEDTTYYFNVIVTDEAGNKSMYTSFSQKTNLSPDTTAPVTGNSGTITGSNVGANGLTLNWTKATDNRSLATALTYQVYYSTSNNLDTVSNTETNGTPIGTASTDIATIDVTGLSEDTTYYFNVIVSDEAGNKSLYTSQSQKTNLSPDTTAPVAGDSGAIAGSNVSASGLTLNWTKATDNRSLATALTYQVYYSTSNNLDTISNTERNGTPIGTASADIATINVTGLSEDTTYYFNVIVSDEAGNKSLYTSQSQKTNLSPDTTAPVVGDSGAIGGSNISASGLTLNWTKATDNKSAGTALTYQAYYSTSNNLDTVSNTETNGTPIGTASTDIATIDVTGLSEDTTYYFNVIVSDEAGNKSLYVSQSQKTNLSPDTTAPVVGNSGTIAGSNISANSITINWTKATDNRSLATALTYQVYYSTSNNIDTVSNMTTNGTAFASAAADIATINVTGLNSDTTYYFNVLVKDEAGNQAAYTMKSLATIDTVAPLAGNSGNMTVSNVDVTSLTLNWTKATDNKSAGTALTYQAYRSTSNNLDTISNTETNGTPIGTASTDIATIDVTGLSEDTTYYFNVIVSDEAGNKSLYTSQFQKTNLSPDTTAPVVGNSGTIAGSNISASGLTVNWTKATDNRSAASALTYQVYYSLSNNIDTVTNMTTNGTPFASAAADIASVNVTGLNSDTTYYFNVLVTDEAGNQAAYTTKSLATLDTVAPVAGNSGNMTVSNVDVTSLTLNWTKATDNKSASTALTYQAYYSTSNNLDTVSNTETNGTPIGTASADIATIDVTGLSEDTTYYFNVIVTDEAGNKSMYTSFSQKTNLSPDTTAPVVGNSGTIAGSNISASGLTLNWTKATDNRSLATALTYQVYYSISNNIDTVSNVTTNGTPFASAAADIASVNVTGLNSDTTYYFNVLVKDEAGNQAAYTTKSLATLDTVAPVVGNSGTMTVTNVAVTSLTLNWTKATDNKSAGTALTYQAYYSTSNNLDTVSNTETNGTPIGTASTDIVTIDVTGLSEDTTYYFNVIVTDEAGNKSLYTSQSQKTNLSPDTTAPIVGNSGAIAGSNISANGLTLSWAKATDNRSLATALTYQVYYSISNNIDTVSNVTTNGTAFGSAAADIATINVTGLNSDTTYYFNVLVKDEVGNQAAYNMQTLATLDTVAPVVGNSGTITVANVDVTGLTLNWTKATDNKSASTALTYQAYYSTSNNLDTVSNTETNGTPIGTSSVDIATIDVTGLNEDTIYYFNVIVTDEAGNKSMYTSFSQKTNLSPDATAPIVGNSGAIAGSNISANGLTLSWAKATDNRSLATALTYQVYYSISNNIDTVSNVTTNGTAFGSAAADIATINVTGLNSDTTYYFNVLVKDEVGNQAAYNMQTLATLDTVAPVVGNSGTITVANVDVTGLTLNWTKAIDNKSAGTALTYQAYRSTSNNLDTISNTETNGTPIGTASTDIATIDVTGLSEDTTYYFNVIVSDEAGNKSLYTSQSQKTNLSPDTTAPVAGDSGAIAGSNVSASGLTLIWMDATDNRSLATALAYQVYYSTSNNIDTATNMTTNGTPFGSPGDVGTIGGDIKTIDVTGLSPNTTYYFNVLVKDEAGNQAAYTTKSLATLDTVAPVAGNSGNMTVSNVDVTSLTLNWTKATDNKSASTALTYQAYYSISNNLNTVSNTETNGTPIGTASADIATIDVTGLNEDTTYYFNVIVTDEAGNKSMYTSFSQKTNLSPDTTAPVAGNSGTITGSNVGANGLTLNWTKATDNRSLATALTYQVYYSTSNNIDTVANVTTNGTPFASAVPDIASVDVTGLNSDATYYFNVLVKDEAGNQAVYTMQMLQTSDTVAPTVGNSGAIIGSNVGANSITLNWTKATDNRSLATALTYQVYYSTSNNIDTVSNMTTNGTAFGSAATDIATINVTGLNSDTTYYFNVLVKDEVGNQAAYTMQVLATLDTVAPVVGNSGTITVANVDVTGLTLNWTKATDNKSASTALTYQAYYSTSNNLDTVSNTETNGTPIGTSSADIATIDVTGLTEDTTYYFNVIVTDEAGNKSMYTSFFQKTNLSPDTTAPVAGNSGTITGSNISASGLTLNWTKATDNRSLATALTYQVYYSTSNNIDTVANVTTNGTPFASVAVDIASVNVTGLNSDTTYYFNILVKDEAGNQAAYTMQVLATLDTVAPVVGNSGTITVTNVDVTGLTLNWTKATDNKSASTALTYQAYYSTSNNLDTVSNTETNGTPIGTASADIATKDVTGLSEDTTYYFNVIVSDEAGNKSLYTSQSQKTNLSPDTTAPVAGNSGTIAGSNISASGLTLNWTKATDNRSLATDLTYQVYYSASNNIDTVANVTTNGTPFASAVADMASVDITGLTANTTYYFNVLVTDEVGNQAVYSMQTLQTTDTLAPTVGNSGTISGSNANASGLTVNWTKATDNRSAASALTYQVYYSLSNNIDTVTNMTTNGIAFASAAADIASVNVIGLNSDTSYYFNILVTDEAGNQAAYTMQVLATLDTVAPVAGNSGTLVGSSIGANSLTLNWTKASDNKSAASALTYQVYYSTTNNIDTLSNVKTNGTPYVSATNDIATLNVTGLTANTDYYFNVLVTDEAGNQAVYTSQMFQTADTQAPSVGNSGVLSGSNISASGLTLSWTKATDNRSLATTLTYQVYYSTINNIDTVSNAITNGTPFDTAGTDIASKDVTGLSANTDYYFNVLVTDEAGNQAVYTMQMLQTSDTLAPTVSNSSISTSNITGSGIRLIWIKATDNRSAASGLTYQTYYSTTNNIDDVANMKANGTPFGSPVNDIGSIDVTGLTQNTVYYFNVLVTDEAGNQSAYAAQTERTADTEAPTVGNSGTISGSSITTNSLTLNWTKASDNKSLATALTYQTYYSTSNNIDSVANMTNGTPIGSASADISTVDVSGLNPNTDYYFNVLVTDEAGNQAVYTMQMLQTTDTIAPTVGNSGTISGSSATASGITLNWTKATDNRSAASALTYQAYYSLSNNIDTVANMTTNGTPFGVATADIATIDVTGLNSDTSYYFNVLVTDEAGNKAVYTMQMLQTADTVAPTIGNSTLSVSSVTGNSMTLSWNKATDNMSPDTALTYQAYYSTSNNLDTISNIETNGTPFGSASADISSVDINGLSDTTTYYLNVIVTDQAGNKAMYTTLTTATSDTTGPVFGNSGAFSLVKGTGTDVTVTWTAATDNLTAASDLEYLVYHANDGSTYVPFGTYEKNITTKTVTGLDSYTDIFFKIYVRDAAGNITSTASNFIKTNDVVPPTIVDGNLTLSIDASNNIQVDFVLPSDFAGTADAFYVGYSTTQSDVDNLAGIVSYYPSNSTKFVFGKQVGSTANGQGVLTTYPADTTIYVNILAQDFFTNRSIYNVGSIQTPNIDRQPPVPGANASFNAVTVTWDPAVDDSGGDITYTLYYSAFYALNNLSAIAQYGGSPIATLTNTTTFNYSGFGNIGIVASDSSGNKSAYYVDCTNAQE